MRFVYRTHFGENALLALVAALPLIGCVKNPEIDAVKSDADQLRRQIAQMQSDADQQKQRATELSARLSKLEEAVAGFMPKREEHPASRRPVQLTTSQVTELKKVVSSCVQTVRALAPPGATPISDVHISFDAYYNPSTGRVENNNQYVSQDAVYAFNKCMTEQGWPLH